MVIIKILSTEQETLNNLKNELNKPKIDTYEIEEAVETLKQLIKLTKKKADICKQISLVFASDNNNRLEQHNEYLNAISSGFMYEKMLQVAENYLYTKTNKNF